VRTPPDPRTGLVEKILFNRPDARIPCGPVAGPRPLAEAMRRALVQRLGGVLRRR
jgi:hypothetical protein